MAHASERIALLARQPQTLFHSHDLAKLWNVQEANTLNVLLRRYSQKGLLFRIYKGLYSLKPISELDPLLLGIKALHRYAYVSTETVLVQRGLMAQMIPAYTLVSSSSRSFQIGPYLYKSRQLQEAYLYNPVGIQEENGILMATPERALADLFYFNPKAYIDGFERVDWAKLHQVQQAVGYPLTSFPHAPSP